MKKRMTVTSKTVKTDGKLKAAVKGTSKKSIVKRVSFVVRGMVRTFDGAPSPGLTVKAFDRNVGVEDMLLGQATTDAQGRYSISYTLNGKPAADLVLKIYKNEKLLQESDVIFNVKPEETRDFIIPVEEAPEFHVLTEKIKPLLPSKLGILSLAKQQIEFLNKKTGIDARKIEWLAKSQQQAEGDETLASFYFGLLSQNFSTDPAAILSQDRGPVEQALKRAELTNQIPAMKPGELDQIFSETLPKLRADNLLRPASAGQPASLGDILKTMPQSLPDAGQRKVADIIGQHGIDYQQLPNQLQASGLAPKEAVLVERTLRLADLTLQSPPLMRRLQEMMLADQDTSLKSLAAIRRDQWINLAYTFQTPGGSNLDPETYAKKLEATIEELHSTAVLAARFVSRDLVINQPGFENMGEFINRHPDLNILNTNIRQFAQKADFQGIADRDLAIAALVKLQRIKKLSATWEETGVLLNEGFTSALDIVQSGKNRLQMRLAGKVDPKRAAVIFEYASKTQQIALALMSSVMPRFSPVPVEAMGKATRMLDASAVKEYPNLQSLFGSLDACECNYDQSVLSPAAYLVDLLELLKDNRNHLSALYYLIQRRPDLMDLQLSVENTNVELPHSDLVLELLENAVALPKQIKLPAGVDVNSALGSKPAASVIIDILQSTASDLIDRNLSASGKPSSLLPGATEWTIVDVKRRWTVISKPVGLYRIETGAASLIVAQAAMDASYQQFLKELDLRRLSEPSKNILKNWLLPGGQNRYLFPSVPESAIIVHQAGALWTVTVSFAVTVLIEVEGQTGTLTLTTPDGEQAYVANYQRGALLASQDGLNRNQIAGALAGLISPVGEYNISPTQENTWLLELPSIELQLLYSPDLLYLLSLTYQTVGDSGELAAIPENENPLAYQRLRSGSFPWSLPFHLPLEAVRLVLERAGVARRQLIEKQDPGAYVENERWMREILGLSPEEADLIVNCSAPPKLWEYWGAKPDAQGQSHIYDAEAGKDKSDAPLALLAVESILMQQARLSYQELQAVLSAQFVGASGVTIKLIDPTAGVCCPCNFMLDPLTAEQLDRIHRFVRLWRKLGWKVDDLDWAIQVFSPQHPIRPFKRVVPKFPDLGLDGPKPPSGLNDWKDIQLLPDITSDLLMRLAQLKRLQELLDLPIVELAVWWDGTLLYKSFALPGEPEPLSIYEQVFLNPRIQNPMDTDFALNVEQTALIRSNIKISDKLSLIAAALGLAQSELGVLFSKSGLADSLNLQNLFELYRTAGLIRALKITASDYYWVKRLANVAPFANTAAMISFCETVNFIRESGFGVGELSYLLQHDQEAAPGLPFNLSDDQIRQTLNALRSGLQAKLLAMDQQVVQWLTEAHPDLVAKDPLDPGRVALLNTHPDFRLQLGDIVATQVKALLNLEFICAKKMLMTDPDGYGRAILNNPADGNQDALSVLLNPDFLSQAGTNTSPAHDLICRLHKISLLFSRLKLRPAEIFWIADAQQDMLVMDFNHFPVAQTDQATELFLGWRRLVTLFKIRDRSSGMAALLGQYVSVLHLPQPSKDVMLLLNVIARGLGLPLEWDCRLTAQKAGITNWDHGRDPLKLQALLDLLIVLKKLGADPIQAEKLTQDWALPAGGAPDQATAAEQLAWTLLQAKYNSDSWREIVKPVSDALRIRKRDALSAYLITRQKLRDENELYEYYLIDTQMSPCMLTSRLVQAIATVQQFVQRCLLNLEKNVAPNWIDHGRWQWMKNYRVWEANRKVFLYPENWLYPELRDDKTEIFRQLESGLAQSEPSYELGKANLLVYLDELSEIAKLKGFGMYEDIDRSGVPTLYVVGRLPDQPSNYYWRKCTRFGQTNMRWSGWERIDLDISDDHVMPFVLTGDFYIAWPTISLTKNTASKNCWEIKLNWARYTKKGWTKKKVSKNVLPLPSWQTSILCQPDINDSAREITFRLKISSDQPANVVFYAYNILRTFTVPLLASETPPGFVWDHPESLPTRGGGELVGYEALSWAVNYGLLGDNHDYTTSDNYQTPAEFIVSLYEMFRDQTGKHKWYAPVVDREIFVTYYYVRTLDDWGRPDKYQVYRSDHGYMSLAFDPPQFKSTLHWVDFEDHGIEKYLTKVEISIRQSGGDKVIVTYVPTIDPEYGVPQVPGTCVLKTTFRETVLTPQWSATALGQFKLTSLEDMTVELIDEAAKELDVYGIDDIYANGHEQIGDSSEEFRLPAVQSAEWKQTPLPDSLKDEVIWYSDCDGQQSYSQWYAKNPGFYISQLAIYDTLANIAALRMKAHTNFAATDGLYSLNSQRLLQTPAFYQHNSIPELGWSWLANLPAVGFDLRFPAGLYNQEIFYHAPLLIAEFLTRQQRFEDAQRWLNYIFNPTAPLADSQTTGAARFWQFLPFRLSAQGVTLQQLFEVLAKAELDPDNGSIDSSALSAITGQISQWEENAFVPNAIARLRPVAYQWRTIFAYLDNLIAWGDQMFRRFTRESINEAIQLYILAAKILGPRPKIIRSPLQHRDLSYLDLYRRWDEFGNAWLNFMDFIDNKLVADLVQQLNQLNKNGDFSYSQNRDDLTKLVQALSSIGMLYFCIPNNEKLMGYWDTIEDRLFKVRHCMDIDGQARELPLFAPPIDPALLVRATAAGLDIATVLAGLDVPRWPYRFQALLQKSNEFCGEVRALGQSLLAALEKKDAEELARLRATQEIDLLGRVTDIKQRQIAEANANVAMLNQNMAVVKERFNQYQKLLGKPQAAAGADGLPRLESSSLLQVAAGAPGEEARLGLVQYEVDQLQSLEQANNFMTTAGIFNTMAGLMHSIPDIISGSAFVMQVKIGGSHFGNAAGATATLFNTLAGNASYEANKKSMFASYQRRQDEWVHQSKLALEEMRQINKQIIAAEIRLAIAEKELANHEKQIANARELDDFMHDKYTNQELYAWMEGEISGIYFKCYQLAYDLAKRVEKACQYDLGVEDSQFIQFGYWNSLKKGLMAGEALSLDLKRMEAAYLEQNQRDLEITKHVSLALLDPVKLLDLKENGECLMDLPEALFDLDYPGHYFRRIKSVSLTIPCVVGPYTSINCTLTLQKNSVRTKNTLLNEKYLRYHPDKPGEDPRFREYPAGTKSIATSHGQNDSGLFEVNFHDERYLPFEGAGVISTWRIELPKEFKAFDYNTISDVVLHLKYTAREGGGMLKDAAIKELRDTINQMTSSAGNQGLVRLFSVKHEFSGEWYRFIKDTTSQKSLNVTITKDHFPFMFRGSTISIAPQADVYVISRSNSTLTHVKSQAPVQGEWSIQSTDGSLNSQDIEDVAVVCYYSVSEK